MWATQAPSSSEAESWDADRWFVFNLSWILCLCANSTEVAGAVPGMEEVQAERCHRVGIVPGG